MNKELKTAVSNIEQIRKGEREEMPLSDSTIDAIAGIVKADEQLDKEESSHSYC